MPFKSRAQVGWMFRNHPDIAHRWAHKYGISKRLPRHVGMAGVLASHARRKKLRKRIRKVV